MVTVTLERRQPDLHKIAVCVCIYMSATCVFRGETRKTTALHDQRSYVNYIFFSRVRRIHPINVYRMILLSRSGDLSKFDFCFSYYVLHKRILTIDFQLVKPPAPFSTQTRKQ